MLRLVDLAKSYGARPILDDVSLTISSGEKIALVGANGVGKTTLLRIITGDEEADAGGVRSPTAGPSGTCRRTLASRIS